MLYLIVRQSSVLLKTFQKQTAINLESSVIQEFNTCAHLLYIPKKECLVNSLDYALLTFFLSLNFI